MRNSNLLLRTLALLLFLVTAPFILIAWLAIKLSDPSQPAFFKQCRVGLGGEIFSTWKMRTLNATNHTALVAQQGDARVTKIGYWLRRTHLDEMLQLINVINGTMVFIGPRPLVVDQCKKASGEIRGWHRRYQVMPGITGLDQVRENYCQSRLIMARDRLLLQNISCPRFKIWIVWQTVCEMCLLRGK